MDLALIVCVQTHCPAPWHVKFAASAESGDNPSDRMVIAIAFFIVGSVDELVRAPSRSKCFFTSSHLRGDVCVDVGLDHIPPRTIMMIAAAFFVKMQSAYAKLEAIRPQSKLAM